MFTQCPTPIAWLSDKDSAALLFDDRELFTPLNVSEEMMRPCDTHTIAPRTNLFIEELKRLASDLAFISLTVKDSVDDCIIVYAGSRSSDTNVLALTALFPRTEIHVYDPYSVASSQEGKLHITKSAFSDEHANFWAKSAKKVIFISDVYLGEKTAYGEGIFAASMEEQANWVVLMAPYRWSIKFRMSPEVDVYSSLPGHLLMIPFAKELSTETRLVGNAGHAVLGAKAAKYDRVKIESTTRWHNRDHRAVEYVYANVWSHDEKAYSELGFNHGYDCSYLLYSIWRYMQSPYAVVKAKSETEMLSVVKKLIAVVSQGRWTLASRRPPARIDLAPKAGPSAITRRLNARVVPIRRQ